MQNNEEPVGKILDKREANTSTAQNSPTPSNKPDLPEGWHRPAPQGMELERLDAIDPCLLEEMRNLFRQKLFPIYLHGAVGRGKSFLAAAIYVRLDINAVFWRYSDFIADVINERSTCTRWDVARHAPVLIMDDIGVGMTHEIRNEAFGKLLDIRKGQPTLFTGNVMPKDLPTHFDARITSRIGEGSLFELTGPDLRTTWMTSKTEISKRMRKWPNTAAAK